MRRISPLLLWTWCLPQTIVSRLARSLVPGRRRDFRGSTVIYAPLMRRLGGVCLGDTILVLPQASEELVCHEWGHARQSRLLGPLYYLVIGLPSVSHAIWHRLLPRGNYFHFYTEAWADAEGGVYDRHEHVHPHWSGYAYWPALLVALGLLALRAFGGGLGLPLTDTDALADIAVARHPLLEQFLLPLTGGYGGSNANFWRPAAMIQFWAQRRLFGWEPLGYHVWDLALHVGVSALVASFVLSTTRDRAIAALTACLFVAHPLTVEVVPAVARNIDLLLGLGFIGGLAALAAGRIGLFWAGAALAIGAKEGGVLIVPSAFVWMWLYGDRRAIVRTLAPVCVGIVGFLAVRAHVLSGLGGYHDDLGDPGYLGNALERAFLEPLFPSLSTWLAPLQGPPGILLCFAIWGAILFVLRGRLLGLVAGLYLPWVLLLGVAGTYNRRVLYVASMALCLLAAWAVLAAWRTRSRAGLAVLAVWGATFVHGSPVFSRYTDWAASGSVATSLTDPGFWSGLAPGATVWLVDRPARVDQDPRRYRLWSKSRSLNNCVAAYALQAWADERWPGRTVRSLTALLPEGDLSRFVATIQVDGPRVDVTRQKSPRTRQDEKSFQMSEDDDRLRIVAGTPPAVLLVWNPAGAVRVDLR